MVLEGKKKLATAIATMKQMEKRKLCFRRFHTFTKPPRTQGGLSHILQNNPDGTTTRVQDPDQLAKTLYQRNRKHFSQAHGTPFTIPPLSNILDFSGVSPAGFDVLQGDLTTTNRGTSHTTAILQEKSSRMSSHSAQ
jgi:hypothetical protein